MSALAGNCPQCGKRIGLSASFLGGLCPTCDSEPTVFSMVLETCLFLMCVGLPVGAVVLLILQVVNA